MQYDFAVVGGDRRQLLLAELLRRDGRGISLTGFDGLAECVPLSNMCHAPFVLLPLPLESEAGILTAPLSDTTLYIDDIAENTVPGQKLFCGKASPEAIARLEENGAEATDYFLSEELTMKNAAITAEGAIYSAMRERESTLLGAKCVVTGFGRIGKQLSSRLASLGAAVTVVARKEADRTLAKLFGCRAEPFESLKDVVSDAELIFNTVPERVFGEEEMSRIQAGCLYIELASAPYGADMEKLKVHARAVKETSLPGRYAPKSAAKAIRDTVYHIMEERGWSV